MSCSFRPVLVQLYRLPSASFLTNPSRRSTQRPRCRRVPILYINLIVAATRIISPIISHPSPRISSLYRFHSALPLSCIPRRNNAEIALNKWTETRRDRARGALRSALVTRGRLRTSQKVCYPCPTIRMRSLNA